MKKFHRFILGFILAVVAALIPVLGTTSPAQAVGTGDEPTSVHKTVQPKTVWHQTAPPWVHSPAAQSAGTTSSVNVDWQWLKGGWVIKFSHSETVYIAIGLATCDSFFSRFSHPALKVLSLACLLLTAVSGVYLARGQCLTIFVPVSLINPQIYGRNC